METIGITRGPVYTVFAAVQKNRTRKMPLPLNAALSWRSDRDYFTDDAIRHLGHRPTHIVMEMQYVRRDEDKMRGKIVHGGWIYRRHVTTTRCVFSANYIWIDSWNFSSRRERLNASESQSFSTERNRTVTEPEATVDTRNNNNNNNNVFLYSRLRI